MSSQRYPLKEETFVGLDVGAGQSVQQYFDKPVEVCVYLALCRGIETWMQTFMVSSMAMMILIAAMDSKPEL